MRNVNLLTLLCCLLSLNVMGQGAKNIKINEVMTNNENSIVDEYNEHLPWVELANVSFTTFNVRGMYIATDTAVLNPKLTVPERIAMMSIIPNNEQRTNMGGKQHLLLYLNSSPAKGSVHLSSTLSSEGSVWVGLYEGNGVDLVDSVTIPSTLPANTSYARESDGDDRGVVKAADAVTPGIENFIHVDETKVSNIKRNDPHGFGITVLSMGIVFLCLALLWIFFTIFGRVMGHRQMEKNTSAKIARKKRLLRVHDEDDEDERAFPGRAKPAPDNDDDDDVYIAVISMALKEYLDNSHDQESGVITILPKVTKWTRI